MSKSALKILNTAEQLFNQHSFAGVGVDLIRDESGCSKTTLYTYYKNKDQLVKSVLIARDERFKSSLLTTIGTAQGKQAIMKIFDWHMAWFQQDSFKGCLFVRAVAESHNQKDIIVIAQQYKQWIKFLIAQHCEIAAHAELSELVYTLIEGLIGRFLVDGFDIHIALNLRKTLEHLLA